MNICECMQACVGGCTCFSAHVQCASVCKRLCECERVSVHVSALLSVCVRVCDTQPA
jgi:hypothetical protein